MVNTYETYREMVDTLTLEECVDIHKKMTMAIGTDEDALDLYRDVLDASWKYMDYRFEWGRKNLQERAKIDERRTETHNAVLRKFEFLVRYLGSIGKDTSWVSVLGDCNVDPTKRKRYGDFAMYLCFVETINQR